MLLFTRQNNILTSWKISFVEQRILKVSYSFNMEDVSRMKRVKIQCVTNSQQSIYTGERLFSCSQCDYKCLTSSDLKKHQRIHTGDKYRWAVNRTVVNFDWNTVRAVNWMTEIWLVTGKLNLTSRSVNLLLICLDFLWCISNALYFRCFEPFLYKSKD